LAPLSISSLPKKDEKFVIKSWNKGLGSIKNSEGHLFERKRRHLVAKEEILDKL
jgi:hypothetical protein